MAGLLQFFRSLDPNWESVDIIHPANTPRVRHVSETCQTGGFRHVSFATLYLRFRNVVWHFLYKMVAFATYLKRGGNVASPTWHWTRV